MSTVVRIENLYKEYRLGVIGHGTLYRDLQSWWAKLRGKEDPNTIIGQSVNAIKQDQILALNDINLEINDQEVLGIIGTNGAGKSTLLKILSKITAPTKGRIKVRGRIASLLEVGTGFHPELTGRENIYLNGAINGMNNAEVSLKLDEIVDFAGVEQFLDTPVKRYSSGMHVRLGFAVAAHLESEILVVDEVLAVGDASFQKKAIGKIKDVTTNQGRTVLFVSHNMESISIICNKCILLEKGKLIDNGHPSDVINNYLDSDSFNTTRKKITFRRNEKKVFQLLEYGIKDHKGHLNNVIDRTKCFSVYAKYIMQENNNHVDVKLCLSVGKPQPGVSKDTSILQWSDIHKHKYQYGNENKIKTKGLKKAEFKIPGYFLNSGLYNVKIMLDSQSRGHVIDNPSGFLNVLLQDNGTSHDFAGGRSTGLLGMPIELQIK